MNFVWQIVIFGIPLMLNSNKEVLITLAAQLYYLENFLGGSMKIEIKKSLIKSSKVRTHLKFFFFLFFSLFLLYMVLRYNYSKKRMRLTSSKGRLSDWTKWGKPFKGNSGKWRRISQMLSSRGRLSKARSLAWREVMQCLILINIVTFHEKNL